MIGSRGTYGKTPATGTCKNCGNTFEYMRTGKDQFYCNATCSRRQKLQREKERRAMAKDPPRNSHAAKRPKLIPYAGKELHKHVGS